MELSCAAKPDQAASLIKSHKLNKHQLHELELLFSECSTPTLTLLQDFIARRASTFSSADAHLLKAWFRSRRLKEKMKIKLSPLMHRNAKLQAEHQSLLLLNSQLRNQAMLLNRENQCLKQELGVRLQQSVTISPASSLPEVSSSRADEEDEVSCQEKPTEPVGGKPAAPSDGIS